jgi:thiol-disulfide isomerase/thioredoxin
MSTIGKNKLVNDLTNRVRADLEQADVNGDGAVSSAERADLKPDVRPVADATADSYFAGGDLPIQDYVNAYRTFVADAATNVDVNSDGLLTDTEQRNLPGAIFSSVLALRTGAATGGSPAFSLEDRFESLKSDGWTDDELVEFLGEAQSQGRVAEFSDRIWEAIMNPQYSANAHAGDRFYEALAWYTDKTIVGSQDERITLDEIRAAKGKKAQEWASLYGNSQAADSRRQTWKFIQKLALLENHIVSAGGDHLEYDAAAMGSVNHNSAWNVANTISTRADFQSDVIDASYDRPVLVKFGLTYCVHCLLLEQLDSVRAVAERYAGEMDVKKVWWNPHDAELLESTGIAQDEGVTSSPHFIVYKDGQPVRAGYAFPDEDGTGMDDLLSGVL